MTEAEALARLRDQGLAFQTRRDWGAVHESTYQWRRANRHVDLPLQYGFVHISVTDEVGDVLGDEHAAMRVIERVGFERFQSGFSYNWGVHDTGRVMVGMPLDAAGTHTVDDKGFLSPAGTTLNYYGHAVCLPQLEATPVTDAQVSSIAAVFAAEKRAGLLTLKGDRLYGHREVAAKSCPGDRMWARMDDCNDLMHDYIRHGLPGGDDDMPAFDDKIPATDGKTFGDAQRAIFRIEATLRRSADRDRQATEALDALEAAVSDDARAAQIKRLRELLKSA
jgi:hypothetical protein